MQDTLKRSVMMLLLVAVMFTSITAVATAEDWKDKFEYLLADGFRMDGYSLVYNANKKFNFYTDVAPINADGTINTVIEIPAGDIAKFEVTEETGVMSWELKNGQPRIIKYLAYPCNYGMVPRTMSGDGDALDCLTLGKMQLRGAVLEAKVIGVIKLIDDGDVDDKLIAVVPGSPLWQVNNMAELEAKYAGVTDILQAWFENYKGPGLLQCLGFGDVDEAMAILYGAMAKYE
jgi:inorganic pyrophosphatase